MTRDPIDYIEPEDPQTLNLYSYCGNDPVNSTDSTGHWKRGDEKLSKSAQNQIKYLTNLYKKATSKASRNWIAKQADKIRNADKNKNNIICAGKFHTDYNLKGEKFLHDEASNLRFNNKGQLVEHSGKVIGEPTGKAARVLKSLRNIKPDFFVRSPLMIFIMPDEIMEKVYNPNSST